ncbi:MAG: hypothetical protein IT168_23480 [Bryobacterales bacterium]|nr:hypothetical protein [Bryobacterales bacterium]
MERSLRISHVGLRGVVGKGLTASHVVDFAAAFGTFLEARSAVVIGRDPRSSGAMIRQGVIASLVACGHQVIDLGLVSTPVIQHEIRRIGAQGGISIGASHHPAEWNALKFFGANGTYLSTAEASELLDIYHLKKFAFVAHTDLGGVRTETDALDAYLDRLAGEYDFDALRRKRVVVDCTNGTSSLILRRLNERYGFQFILINERIEGDRFAHEPITNQQTVSLQLAPLIKPLSAEGGFLFDVDSDRLAIATEEGRPVSEEMILPLLADHLLPTGPGKLVITNLSSTALTDEVAARHGGRVIRVPVGRAAAMDALATYPPEEIAVAGEGTGAVMMPRFRFIYDGIASMLAILTMMDRRGQSLSEILAGYPRYCMLKGQVPLVSPKVPELFMELEEAYRNGQLCAVDGVRVDWPDRWFHVRVSQTESVVRVICERRGSEPKELFDELLDRVRRLA